MQAIANIAHYGGEFNVFQMDDGSFRVGAAHDTAADLANQIGGKFSALDRAVAACTAASNAMKARRAGTLEFSNQHADI